MLNGRGGLLIEVGWWCIRIVLVDELWDLSYWLAYRGWPAKSGGCWHRSHCSTVSHSTWGEDTHSTRALSSGVGMGGGGRGGRGKTQFDLIETKHLDFVLLPGGGPPPPISYATALSELRSPPYSTHCSVYYLNLSITNGCGVGKVGVVYKIPCLLNLMPPLTALLMGQSKGHPLSQNKDGCP